MNPNEDRYIQNAGVRFRVQIRLRTGKRAELGTYKTLAEARAVRDKFMAENPDKLPRMRGLKRQPHEPMKKPRDSLWSDPERDRIMRAEYQTCRCCVELAQRLGVTTEQLYGRAKRLKLYRADTSRRAAIQAAMRKIPGGTKVEDDGQPRRVWRPAVPGDSIVGRALASMPALQAAMHLGWRVESQMEPG